MSHNTIKLRWNLKEKSLHRSLTRNNYLQLFYNPTLQKPLLCSHNSVLLSSLLVFRWMVNKSSKTDTTRGAGTTYPSVFSGISVAKLLVF